MIPIGLQLYSIREDCAKDLPGTLKKVAAMGYAGVEFAVYHGRSAEEIRAMLDDCGLACCGTHIGIQTLLGDALSETMAFNRIIGNEYLIVPGLPAEHTASRAAWANTARTFSAVAAAVKPHGFRTGYHNHHTEFAPLDGELPWDTFFSNASSDVVMQFDTGNAMHGGGDPTVYLRRYPGRALTIHLKEFSRDVKTALIGEGDMPWKDIFTLCETIGGTRWYIVEQESYAYPPLECVERCLKNIRAMGT